MDFPKGTRTESNEVFMKFYKKFVYEKHTEFAKEHNLSAPNISMVLSGKNKHHKGWTFKEIKSM